MAPPLGNKLAANLANETPAKTPVQPVTPKKKQRDMSHSSPGVPQAPTTKIANPDLGMQQNTGPEAPPIPHGPPVPALQRYGVNMSINDVNTHVDQMAAAHLKAYGYNPSPGLVYDLLKANGLVGPINYNDLFGIAHSSRDAVAMGTARMFAGGNIPNLPPVELDTKSLVKGLATAVQTDLKRKASYKDFGIQTDLANQNALSFWKDNKEQLDQAFDDPHEREQLVKGLMKVAPYSLLAMKLNPTLTPSIVRHDFARFKLAEIHTEGLSAPKGIVGALIRPFSQIGYATTDMPFGFYQLGRSIGLDAFDLSTVGMHALVSNETAAKLGLPSRRDPVMALHTAHMITRMGQQVWDDINNPTQRPGYLLMDIWGGATLKAGLVGRLSAAARAEGVGATTRALVFKPAPDWTMMGASGHQIALPLVDTTAVKWLQKYTPLFGREARQQKLIAAQTNGYDDLIHEALVNRFMSTEDMIRRGTSKQNQIMEALALTPAVELTRLNRWDAVAKSVMSEFVHGRHDWKQVAIEQKLGVQKALHLILSDSPDPEAEWRGYHENEVHQLTEAKSNFVQGKTQELIDAEGHTFESATRLLEKNPAYSRALQAFDQAYEGHLAQLQAIDLGKRIILDAAKNPNHRFAKVLQRAYETAQIAEDAMREVSGFPKVKAEEAIAMVGARLTHQTIIHDEQGLRYITEDENAPKVISEYEKNTKKAKAAETRLKRAQSTARIAPGTNEEEIANATKAFKQKTRILQTHQKRYDKLLANAEHLERRVTPESDYGLPENPSEVALAAHKLRQGGPGSMHVPMLSIRHQGDSVPNVFGVKSRFGLRPVEYPIKANTGKSLEMGDYRMDVSNLLAEHMVKAYRAVTQYVQHRDLWEQAVKTPISSRHKPIRDIKTIPDELRTFVEALERAQGDQRFLGLATETNMDALRKHLFPNEEDVRNGVVPASHVRYVDENLILDKVGRADTQFWQTLDHMLSKGMGPINNPQRIMLIFGTPAYALNALGSASLLLIHQGFLAPFSLGRAMGASHIYGDEVTRILDRLAGQTHASTLQAGERGLLGGTSQALQNGWGHVTDTYFRRAAVIHELRRHGLLRDEMTNEELAALLKHEDNRVKVSLAAQTARKAMIDYNSMSWPERAVLRHIFFVYTFVRSSTIWSLRFLRDHGVMADVLAQAGRDRGKKIDELIGHMPEWFMRSGYFAVNPHQVYNPIQWNMPGMLEQTAMPIASIFGHTPYSSAAELWGPASTVGVEAFTGVDTQGKQLPGGGGNIVKALRAQWAQTPLGLVASRQAKAKKQAANPVKPPAVRSSFGNPISAALQHERSGLNQSVFENDGFWNTWGQSLFRSGIPRNVDAIAGEARYWRDLRETDPAAYHQHEMNAVLQMVKRQQKVVGEPVSGDVIRAVDTIAHVSQAIEDYKLKHKGEPTPNEKQIAIITLDTLVQEGHIKDAKAWRKKIVDATDLTTVKAYHTQMLLQSGGQAWKDWVDKVNAIDNYAQPKFVSHIASLAANGLGDYTPATKADKPTHWAYGRKVEAFKTQSSALAAYVGSQTGSARKEALQAWLKFVDSQDKEVTINGVTFPSPVAYEFASKTPQQQYKAVASYTKKKVSDLSAFQQQLLTGERPDPIVRKAWETLDAWMKDAHQNAPLGHAPQSGTYATYFKYLQSKDPAVKAAFDFSLKPLGQRMATYQPIQNSPHASDWDWLLSTVNGRVDVLRKSYINTEGKPRQSVVSDVWKRHDVPVLLPLVEKRSPAFLSELRAYTGATSDANAEAYLIKFLGKLGAP